MAGVNITNSGLLLTNYENMFVETLNMSSKARQGIPSKKYTGSHLEWALHTARSGAISWIEDGGAFPVAGAEAFTRAKAYRRFVSASLQISDGAMAAGSGGKAVLKDVLDTQVKGMMENLLKQENGFFFRNGDGSVGTVKTGSSGTTLIIDDARMLWEGGTFDVYDSSLATNRGSFTVTSIASAPTAQNYATVTTSTLPAGTTSGDKVVWQGSVSRVLSGLDLLIDDAATTFQNVNVATYPRYSSLVLDNGGSAQDLTPTLFRQVMVGLSQKTGSDSNRTLKCVTSNNQAMNVSELYESEIRITPDTKTVGSSAVAFTTPLGKVTIDSDHDCPYGKMFFYPQSEIERVVQQELGWRTKNEAMFKRDDSAARYTATALGIYDLRILERNACAKLENLNESPVTMY